MKALVTLSSGDMRRALNILQVPLATVGPTVGPRAESSSSLLLFLRAPPWPSGK